MAVVCPKLCQGYAEVAWSDLTKMLHGVQHVSPEVRRHWTGAAQCLAGGADTACTQAWQSARDQAKRAAGLAAVAQNEWGMAASVYDLAFLQAVGPAGDTFDLGEVKRMLFDVDQIERRLDAWGMRKALHRHSVTRGYLMRVHRDWDAPESGQGKAKRPRRSEWPVTDWRCFEQRCAHAHHAPHNQQGHGRVFVWLRAVHVAGMFVCLLAGLSTLMNA